MIKIFRNIRKNLLNEGKSSKYFKYAIGEIVLVMAGILLALQVNNWNEFNKEKQLEQLYIKNILNDLKDQDTSFNVQITYEQSYFKASNHIIKDFQQHNTLMIDSIFFKLATILTSRKTFVITDPTYTDLISSGNINLLKNVEFKDRLIKYYQELERIEKVIQNNNSLLVDQNYISIFNKSGYYYEPNLIKLSNIVEELNEEIIMPKYKIKLQEISKKIILKEENLLAFMNALYLRNTVAIGNYELLKEIQSDTQLLITDLEQLNND